MDNFTHLGLLLPRFTIELLAAFICGALFGLERGRGIGLRESILVCVGSTLMMIVSELVDLSVGEGGFGADPGRLAGYIVVGVGLLGVGAALAKSEDRNPLSAAVTVWISGGVGLLIGVGYPLIGMLFAVGVAIAMLLVKGIEGHLVHKPRPMLLKLTVREDSPALRKEIEDIFDRQNLHPDNYRAESIPNGVKITITASTEPPDPRPLLSALWAVPGVIEIEY